VRFKLKLGVATLAVALVSVVALAAPALASAYWVSGWTFFDGGTQILPHTLVHIYNNTTNSPGSTYSSSSGAYSFTGMVAGDNYHIWGCWVGGPGNARVETPSQYFTQPARDYVFQVTYIDNWVGGC
jgi:hypothetical protein